MGKIKLIRFSAATLVETIVALVIIMTVFGIAATVLIQTNTTSFSTKKIKADNFIEQFARETVSEKSFFDDQKDLNLFTLQKKIEENRFDQETIFVKFSAFDKNGKLISYQNRIFKLK